MKKISLFLAAALLMSACRTSAPADPLPSWNNTPVKQQILDFVEQQTPKIPVEDRVAVFDMDGTVACEQPMWFELVVAVEKMMEKLEADPSLGTRTEYRYTRQLTEHPGDTAIMNHWFVDGKDYLKIIKQTAFEGMEHEEYVRYANRVLNEKKAWNGMKYSELFYQPMLELIGYLESREYEVYIVSGSLQGVVWSICPQETGLDRRHLIGTRQALDVRFPKDGPISLKIRDGVYLPKNNYYGKSINIYNQTGRIPVIAVGNTAGDFGMFHMASCSPYPHLALMLNHDDGERERVYPPYYPGSEVPAWRDSLSTYGWIQADMSKEFKTVWKERK